jgi:hypothetical protein
MIKPKSGLCHYTGHYYCYDCIAKEKMAIPWYAKENFDFTLHHVCKTAFDELKKFYDKPNILIEYKSEVVKKNKILYETLVTY